MKEKDNNFIKNVSGAVALEFVFMMFLLALMFAFMADLVTTRGTVGRLERTSYSLLNVVKERVAFGKKRDTLEQWEVDELQRLAKALIHGNENKGEVDVVVEYLEFEPANNEPTSRLVKIKKRLPPLKSKNASADCQPLNKLESSKLQALSPRAEINPYDVSAPPRYVPLYQVTVCTEINSLFTEITNRLFVEEKNKNLGVFRSSSAGVTR